MSGFGEDGFHKPGTIGRAHHLGAPLTAEQIRELPDGAEVVITWCGGSGPWPYRVLVDQCGGRRVENPYPDMIVEDWDRKPFCRVTLGWDDEGRAWHERKIPEPAHIRAEWARLRDAAAHLSPGSPAQG